MIIYDHQRFYDGNALIIADPRLSIMWAAIPEVYSKPFFTIFFRICYTYKYWEVLANCVSHKIFRLNRVDSGEAGLWGGGGGGG